SGCVSSDRTPVVGTVNTLPSQPVVVGDEVCDAGEVSLAVTSPNAGYDYKWFDSDQAGTLLHTGSRFTPSIISTTTYYVEAVNSSGCVSS
ncbi:immunoglobulin domain-containing protein, partial [Xanthovirga aplysinae]|uniref:immunoglobulin domain-containing protein n=1 Tax=Xanthovirga aplysinae TaxID=2529853 RepID=UPI001CA425FC